MIMIGAYLKCVATGPLIYNVLCVCVFFVGTKNEKCSIEVITDASIELHSLFELKYHLVFGDGQ